MLLCVYIYTNETTAKYEFYILGFRFIYLQTNATAHCQTALQLDTSLSLGQQKLGGGYGCHLQS